LGDEQITLSVKEETGKSEMERCGAMMAGQLFSRPNGVTGAVNKYDEFFVIHILGVFSVQLS